MGLGGRCYVKNLSEVEYVDVSLFSPRCVCVGNLLHDDVPKCMHVFRNLTFVCTNMQWDSIV